jgi:hypothetical protein
MELAAFKKSAAFITQRNVSDRVARVLASFDADSGSLRLIYCVEPEPTDDDWEDCELACGELIAEFPEIAHAETDCRSISQCPAADDNSVVFLKP